MHAVLSIAYKVFRAVKKMLSADRDAEEKRLADTLSAAASGAGTAGEPAQLKVQ